MLTVACWLWFDPLGRHNSFYRYDTTYVTKLKSMLDRHLPIPHELVCVTDMTGRLDGVRVLPNPPEVVTWPGHLRRLYMWHPNMGNWLGATRVLLIDLDVVILRDMTPVVDRSEDLVMWEPRLYYKLKGQYSRYNTGFVLMTPGCRPQVWHEFTVERAQRELGSKHEGVVDEQSWVSNILGDGEATWPWNGDVVSLKAVPNPEQARIVFFNGPRAPGMATLQREYPWITKAWG